MIDKIKVLIKKTAKELKIHPSELTSVQFWLVCYKEIPEWQVRKYGGFNNIKNSLFPKNKQIINSKRSIYKLLGVKIEK